jgi:hypothetical protein
MSGAHISCGEVNEKMCVFVCVYHEKLLKWTFQHVWCAHQLWEGQ